MHRMRDLRPVFMTQGGGGFVVPGVAMLRGVRLIGGSCFGIHGWRVGGWCVGRK